ncbi:right-handed parallel beta-helix repeat-containing protein [Streptomyces sp. MC1]|uniref:right-handed parallel beta-helix repeat-containing protein n=1 Tax=unclassified Streptomyces TaxID=2593676 RepID=UPI000A783469|nr:MULTISPECIES: right-handed parallel beta-helix repeat-containing protein [unclassified Streptomyces]MBG7697732.1 right-handed parallel beta-helix repeat-containing protein [Streptomyces sp. MC1]
MALRTMVDVTAFGADPSGTRDSAAAVADALRAACAATAPVTVRFPPGRYHLYPERAERRDLYVSNTVGADRRHLSKTIALLVENAHDLVIDGRGAALVLHGAQTAFAAIDSADVRFEGFSFDYVSPRVVDATVADAGTDGVTAWRELALPADTRFRIDGTTVTWLGEPSPVDGEPYWTGTNAMEYTQLHDPVARRTWRDRNPLFDDVAAVRQLPGHRLRLSYHFADAPGDVGLVYQMRTTVRDHPGAFISGSERVEIRDVAAHYLHGFGLVGQMSRDLTVRDVRFRADPATGRTSAGFADFINLSSMAGHVRIADCVFDGPHDDPINVHGTYLVVADRVADDIVTLAYRHPETAGFPAFRPGDTIEFTARATLDTAAGFTARLTAADGPHDRDDAHDRRIMTVTLDRPLPPTVTPEHWVAENVTATASVHIVGNHFVNVPTRGVLVTTRRPVVIEGNLFDGVTMAGVYVSADAEEWYESGPVADLTIRDNTFLRPSTPAVLIAPTNPVLDPAHPVHRNVTISGNVFEDAQAPVVRARSVRGLTVTGNHLTGTGAGAYTESRLVAAEGCSDVVVEGTSGTLRP